MCARRARASTWPSQWRCSWPPERCRRRRSPAALGARAAGYERLLVPAANASEAALVDGVEATGVPSLARLADLLHGRWEPEPVEPALPAAGRDEAALDLADVRGQEDAKRA